MTHLDTPSLITLALLVLLAAAADIRTRRIPNPLTATGAIAGFILNTALHGIPGARSSLLGLALGAALFLPSSCSAAAEAATSNSWPPPEPSPDPPIRSSSLSSPPSPEPSSPSSSCSRKAASRPSSAIAPSSSTNSLTSAPLPAPSRARPRKLHHSETPLRHPHRHRNPPLPRNCFLRFHHPPRGLYLLRDRTPHSESKGNNTDAEVSRRSLIHRRRL